MQEQFRQGFDCTEEIMMGKASWDKLFEPPNFFTKYKLVCLTILFSRVTLFLVIYLKKSDERVYRYSYPKTTNWNFEK